MVGEGAPFHFFLALECQQGWGGSSQGSLVCVTAWCFGAQQRQAASHDRQPAYACLRSLKDLL